MLKDIVLPNGLTLRPSAAAADGVFMEELFRSTREHFYSLPMPREYVDLLVAQQYQLQQASYARQWPDAYTLIIEASGKSVGKITLDESETALHVIDFVLEPGTRGKGYGTLIVRALQAGTERRGLPIRLSVDRQNHLAKRLYLRLGFTVTGGSATHEAMAWPAKAAEAINTVSNIKEEVMRVS